MDVDHELVEAYRKISPKYTRIKRKPWKDFQQYMQLVKQNYSLPTSGILLDIGTGNCRNLLYFENQSWEHIASDISFELLNNSIFEEKNKIYRMNNDMKFLPFREKFADLAICIATLHHLRNKNDVVRVLKTISKTLKEDNYLIISIWRRWKKGSKGKMLKDCFIYPLKKLQNRFWRHGDIYLSWFDNNKEVVARRYYHLFTKREIVKRVKKSGLEIIDYTTLGGVNGKDNIFLLLRKNT